MRSCETRLGIAAHWHMYRYKLGDAFIMLPLPDVQDLLAKGSHKIEQSVSATEQKLSSIREEMDSLKVDLYARFGKSINLET